MEPHSLFRRLLAVSRSFPILVTTILVAGVMGAEAHHMTRPATPSAVLSSRSVAFAGAAGVQSDDLAAKVKEALKGDPDLGGPSDGVTVNATGGVVTLEGTVPSVQVRAKMGELVLKVEGVTKLNNKLKLAKK
jgi:osmotically-inducible protein OsmY